MNGYFILPKASGLKTHNHKHLRVIHRLLVKGENRATDILGMVCV